LGVALPKRLGYRSESLIAPMVSFSESRRGKIGPRRESFGECEGTESPIVSVVVEFDGNTRVALETLKGQRIRDDSGPN
jgi:hypothetical protein